MPMPEVSTAPPASPRRADSDAYWAQCIQRVKAHETKEVQRWDKYAKLYRDGEFQEPGKAAKRQPVSVNLTFPYVNIMVAALHAQAPTIAVSHRPEAGYDEQRMMALLQSGQFLDSAQACKFFARTLQTIRTYVYNETRTGEHIDACLFEAFARGLGVLKIGWDGLRGVDRVDCLRRSEVYFDPNARYMAAQGQYVVHTPVMGLDEASSFFESIGVPPNTIAPNYSLAEGSDLASQERKRSDDSNEENDLYKFHEIWYKGPDGTRWVRYRPWEADKWLTERLPWPFLVDEDDFPFQPLYFHGLFGQVADAFTALHVVEGLRKTYEDMFQVFHERVRRSLAKKVLFDESVFDAAKQARLQDASQMGWVPIKLPDGKGIRDVIYTHEFNGDQEPELELAHLAKTAHETVTSIDELKRGGQTGRMSATEAQVRADNAEINMRKFADRFDVFLNRVEQGRAQIARQLMNPDKVSKIAGKLGALVWQVLGPGVDDLLSQYSVSVISGSSGVRAKNERLERLMLQFKQGQEINRDAGGLPVIDLVALSSTMADVGGEVEPSQFVNQEMADIYLSGQMMLSPQPSKTGESDGAPPQE